jgi:DNA-binding transcriptional regulator/RsmH inhibitor MraZ
MATEPDRYKIKFRGRYNVTMRNGAVLMPQSFLPFMKEEVHLVAIEKDSLILIPEDVSAKKQIEEDMREIASSDPKVNVSYFGTTKLREGGRLFIPEDIRDFVGLTGPEVVPVGCGRTVEIWDKKEMGY